VSKLKNWFKTNGNVVLWVFIMGTLFMMIGALALIVNLGYSERKEMKQYGLESTLSKNEMPENDQNLFLERTGDSRKSCWVSTSYDANELGYQTFYNTGGEKIVTDTSTFLMVVDQDKENSYFRVKPSANDIISGLAESSGEPKKVINDERFISYLIDYAKDKGVYTSQGSDNSGTSKEYLIKFDDIHYERFLTSTADWDNSNEFFDTYGLSKRLYDKEKYNIWVVLNSNDTGVGYAVYLENYYSVSMIYMYEKAYRVSNWKLGDDWYIDGNSLEEKKDILMESLKPISKGLNEGVVSDLEE